jgi:Uma2 family endonuclease
MTDADPTAREVCYDEPMSSTRPITAEELLRMGEGKRELVLGEVVELTPPGIRHGRIQTQVAHLLKGFVDEAGTDDYVTTESGYKLTFGPDTVRAPDVAVVCAARTADYEDEIGYLPFAPDLAVEVVSPSDSFTDVETKARMWIAHGARLVWVVEPDSRRVLVYERGKDRRDLGEDDVLEAGELLPGFSVTVSRLFP